MIATAVSWYLWTLLMALVLLYYYWHYIFHRKHTSYCRCPYGLPPVQINISHSESRSKSNSESHSESHSRKVYKIAILGICGVGKSTLAKELARSLGLVYIELDHFGWQPGWKHVPLNEFQDSLKKELERVEEAIQKGQSNGWVIDGNWKGVRCVFVEEVTHFVWLDFAFPLVFCRLTARIFSRWWNQTPVCNGNVESLLSHFSSRDSLYYWLWTRFSLERLQEYKDHPAYKIHLINPNETKLLKNIIISNHYMT
eukprot:TRINITY_DN9022_c0_g1_i1.p1 TRINITY_DN9022_c0_g1~~TRINITY_DN9022_c0_g1_i1.p1  ORF type:complete len:255 (-),score=17.66 TRINITY_DN9022_c0_g1_i1:73-837(-)